MLQVGKSYKLLTRDGLRFGGPIREIDGQFLRLFDVRTGNDVILSLDAVFRAEETIHE